MAVISARCRWANGFQICITLARFFSFIPFKPSNNINPIICSSNVFALSSAGGKIKIWISKFFVVFPIGDIHIRIRALRNHTAYTRPVSTTQLIHIFIRLPWRFSCLSIYWQIPVMKNDATQPYSFWKNISLSHTKTSSAVVRLLFFPIPRKRWALNSTCHFKYCYVPSLFSTFFLFGTVNGWYGTVTGTGKMDSYRMRMCLVDWHEYRPVVLTLPPLAASVSIFKKKIK